MNTVTSQPTTGKEELGIGTTEDSSGGTESMGLKISQISWTSVKPERGGLISQVWHLSNGVWIEETPEVEFRMLRYPHWRCQLLKPSKIKSLDKDTSFISLQVNHSLKDFKGDMEHPKSALPKYIQKKGLQKGNMKKVKQGDKDSPMLDFLLVDPANSPLIFPKTYK